MTRRNAQKFHPGDTPYGRADKLNRMSDDLYRLVGGFTVAAPMNMMDNAAGIQFWIDWSVAANVIVTNYLNNLTLNFTTDTFNFTTDTFNYTSNTFNYFLQNVFNINTNAFNIYNFASLSTGVGGIVFNVPFMICGYLFECCTTISLSASSVNDMALPAVGSPDSGATVYDITTSNAGGTTVTGIVPPPFTLCNNGDVSGATGNGVSPIVLTVPAWFTQPAAGQYVVVKGVNGNTAANGTWVVTSSTATTVTLTGTTGNGAFAASPGSTIQLLGPATIKLVNVGANSITLQSNSASSKAQNRIFLPPTYGTAVPLLQNDTITLWWDYCTDHAWKVLACTVDTDAAASLTSFVESLGSPASLGITFANVQTVALTAGTYLLHAVVNGTATFSPSGTIGFTQSAQFNDGTNPVGPVVTVLECQTTSGLTLKGTATIVYKYVATGNVTLALQAKASSTMQTTVNQIDSGSTLGYIKTG